MSKFTILLITAVLSFIPISELRGSIPFAIACKIPWYYAFLVSVVFNALAAPCCWLFLETIHKLLYGTSPEKGIRLYKKIFDSFVERARKKLSKNMERWGWLGIVFFVAVPLPLTGAWTGTLGSWILGISKRKTIAVVMLGVFIAGIIIIVVVMLGLETLNFFIKRIDAL